MVSISKNGNSKKLFFIFKAIFSQNKTKNMAYTSCPNCYNSEKGTSIHQCKECNFVGCFKGGGLLSSNTGCFSKSYCPSCGKSDHKQLDRL